MIATNFKAGKRLMTRVHFNRVEMQRGGLHVWTVHNSLGCFQVKTVSLRTDMDAVFKPAGQQPRAFFKGLAIVEVKNGHAILT